MLLYVLVLFIAFLVLLLSLLIKLHPSNFIFQYYTYIFHFRSRVVSSGIFMSGKRNEMTYNAHSMREWDSCNWSSSVHSWTAWTVHFVLLDSIFICCLLCTSDKWWAACNDSLVNTTTSTICCYGHHHHEYYHFYYYTYYDVLLWCMIGTSITNRTYCFIFVSVFEYFCWLNCFIHFVF